MIAMQDAGFILGSYALTFATVGAFAWRVLRQGRRLGEQVDDLPFTLVAPLSSEDREIRHADPPGRPAGFAPRR